MVILIDNGHGQETCGKSSPLLDGCGVDVPSEFVSGNRFKEWKYARVISRMVVDVLKAYGYDARLLVDEDADVSLADRVKRVNKVCDEEGKGNVVLVSVHANAVGDGSSWMNGTGWECYTTRGRTASDELAECLYSRAGQNFNDRKMRKDTSDGDSDKESDFYILRNSKCVAVLTENFFYDNKYDLKYMVSDEGVHAVVRTHVEGILDYIQKKRAV